MRIWDMDGAVPPPLGPWLRVIFIPQSTFCRLLLRCLSLSLLFSSLLLTSLYSFLIQTYNFPSIKVDDATTFLSYANPLFCSSLLEPLEVRLSTYP